MKSDLLTTRTNVGSEGRLLAVDYGSKRIGLAMSDLLGIIARGAGIIANDASLLPNIAKLVMENDIGRIVVGMPFAPDGGKGSKAREVDEFIATLGRTISVHIEPWDESYTSVNAQRVFREGGMKKKKRQQKERVDEMAARLLLQDYLDCHQRGSGV